MSLVEGGSNGMVMPVGPMYGNGYGNGMFGGDGWWVILFLFAMMGNGNWGFGNGGGSVSNDVSRGFDNLGLSNQINGISNQMSNGFDGQATREQLSSISSAISNGFSSAEVAACNRAMNNMQTQFNVQTAITEALNNMAAQQANCCCENRLATCQTQNAIVSQAAETRYQAAQNTRDIITAIGSGIQTVLDKQCQMELDQYKTQVGGLQTENALLRNQRDNQAQTQTLIQDNSMQTAALMQRLAPTPIPAYIVTAPGTTPTPTNS